MRRFLLAATLAFAFSLVGMITLGVSAESPQPTHFDKDIRDLNEQIARVENPAERRLLETKLAQTLADQEAVLASRAMERAPGRAAALERANREAEIRSAEADRKPEVRMPVSPAGEGVISDGARPTDLDRTFVSTNAWIKELGNREVLVVYAGVSTSDRTQGLIRVYRQGYYGFPVTLIGEFAPKAKAGPLRVISGVGSVVAIEPVAGGARITFDAASLLLVEP